jgi:hypothetical protein
VTVEKNRNNFSKKRKIEIDLGGFLNCGHMGL